MECRQRLTFGQGFEFLNVSDNESSQERLVFRLGVHQIAFGLIRGSIK